MAPLPKHNPTPDEIQRACEAIRLTWSNEERELRRQLKEYFEGRAKSDGNLRSFTTFYQTGEKDPELEAMLKKFRSRTK